VIPGLIDIHVHGADGHDVMDATPEAIHALAGFIARHGVTSYLPTTCAASAGETRAAIENLIQCRPPLDGARHLGVHLEGPYVGHEYRGAQRRRTSGRRMRKNTGRGWPRESCA